MKPCERVFAALEKKEPDRIPILEWSIDAKVIDQISKGCTYFEFIDKMDLDAVRVGQTYEDHKRSCKIIDKEKKIIKDKWGIVRQFSGETLWFPIDAPIKIDEDLKNYNPPDPLADDALGRLPQAVNQFKGRKAIVYALNDAFLIPSELRGMSRLFLDYIESPRIAKEITEMCVDYSIKEAERAINAGAEIIMLRDDYAYSNGLMMSPLHFKEFIFPGLKRIVRFVKEKGAYCVKHCDGNIWAILDMIIETGVDAINPLEPAAGMHIGKVKQKYGNKVCLIGNIDCGELLSRGSREMVAQEVRRCIKMAGPGGGYIMSSSNSIHSSVKPENYLALVETTRKFGKYPIST